MKRDAVKNIIYGGLLEMIQTDRFYRRSSVSRDYSGLTEAGKTALIEYIDDMAWRMYEAENDELNARAKEMVLKELKKQHD